MKPRRVLHWHMGNHAMKQSVLMLSPSCEGWKLLDNGKPMFWFPDKAAALEVANTMAEARYAYSNLPTAVELETEGAPAQRLSSFG